MATEYLGFTPLVVPEGKPPCRQTNGFCNTTGICFLSDDLVFQAAAGGDPLPDSNLANGPVWPRHQWESFTRKLVKESRECAMHEPVCNLVTSITAAKRENGDFR